MGEFINEGVDKALIEIPQVSSKLSKYFNGRNSQFAPEFTFPIQFNSIQIPWYQSVEFCNFHPSLSPLFIVWVLLCLFLSCGFSHSSHPLNIPIVIDLSMYLHIYCHFHDFLHLLFLNLDSHTYKAPNDTQRQILLLLLLLLNCSGFSIYQITGSWKPYKRAFSQLRATAVHRHLGRFALSTRKMGPNIEKVGPK